MTTPLGLKPALLALALLAVWPAAQAQSKKELVAKVIQLRQPAIEAIARSMAGQPAQNMLAAAGQAMSRVPADKRDAVGKQVQADVKAFYDDAQARLRDAGIKAAASTLGPVLEEKFSEDELKQIVAWLQSSAAKKFEEFEPDMQNQLSRKMFEDTRPAVEPRLQALQLSVQKRFAEFPMPAATPSTPAQPAPAASAAKPAVKK